jgi:hypothetical protein
MHAMLKHDSDLYCMCSVSTLLPLDDGLDMVNTLGTAVLCLVLVHLIDESWMWSYIH